MFGDRYESAEAPFLLQKFESADYGDESPRMVVHTKSEMAEKSGGGKRGNQKQASAPSQTSHIKEAIFDISQERNKGNQFWKFGRGREQHRALEMQAKQRRQEKKEKKLPIAKVQILEEPLSDEVSPGVERTLSAQITPTSAPKKGGQPMSQKATTTALQDESKKKASTSEEAKDEGGKSASSSSPQKVPALTELTKSLSASAAETSSKVDTKGAPSTKNL